MSAEEREGLVDAMAAASPELERADIEARLDANDELGSLMRALDGAYVLPAPGGDLLKNPEVLPTGRNIHKTLVPIVGNVISNIAIVTAGLTVSVQLATFGLAYLVIIHKLEYLLNSRIIGSSIDTPMWMTLIGIVVGEAMMGVPGVLLAPALLHYAREEMRALPSKA